MNGRACSADDPGGACDWDHRILDDRLLAPAPGTTVRMLAIESVHRTGSGIWPSVLVLACEAGRLVKRFERRYLNGVVLRPHGPDHFRLTADESHGARRVPSRTDHFRWSPARETYELIRTERGRTPVR